MSKLSKKRGLKSRKGNAKVGRVTNSNLALGGTSWIKTRQIAFPDSLRTTLKYVIPLQQVLGGGTTNSLRFTSNAYDVDTALGSTAMAGFTELAAVYSRFRTLAVKYSFKVANQEAFPVQMVHGVMTNSVGSTALGANYAENQYMHESLLCDVRGGHSSRTFTGRVDIAKLFGTPQALFDDLFTGSTTASTLSSSSTANIYIGGVSAAVPVAGWFVEGFIELDLAFIRRNSILS